MGRTVRRDLAYCAGPLDFEQRATVRATVSETAAVTAGSYNYIKVQKIDDYTVKVLFSRPTPFWADPFVAANGCLIPKHLFEPYIGAKSRHIHKPKLF